MDMNAIIKKLAAKNGPNKEALSNYHYNYVQMGPSQPILAPHSGTFEVIDGKNSRYSNGSNTGSNNPHGMSFGGKKITQVNYQAEANKRMSVNL